MRQTLGNDSELAGPSGISIYRQPSYWLVIDSRRKLSSPQIPQGSSPRRSNVIYRNPLCEECAGANTRFPKIAPQNKVDLKTASTEVKGFKKSPQKEGCVKSFWVSSELFSVRHSVYLLLVNPSTLHPPYPLFVKAKHEFENISCAKWEIFELKKGRVD